MAEIVRTNSTFDVLKKVEKFYFDTTDRVNNIKDDPNLVMRCETLLGMYRDLMSQVEVLAPNVEQLKGMTGGISLSGPVVGQYTEILKSELSGDTEKLKFSIGIVSRIVKSIQEAILKQKEELSRLVGKFDGSVNSAMSVLQKIKVYLDTYDTRKKTEQDLHKNPFEPDEIDATAKVEKPSLIPVEKKVIKRLGQKRKLAREKATDGCHN